MTGFDTPVISRLIFTVLSPFQFEIVRALALPAPKAATDATAATPATVTFVDNFIFSCFLSIILLLTYCYYFFRFCSTTTTPPIAQSAINAAYGNNCIIMPDGTGAS